MSDSCSIQIPRIDSHALRGQLDYPLLRRTELVILEPEHIEELITTVDALRELAVQITPPDRLAKRTFCAKCAFDELCYG